MHDCSLIVWYLLVGGVLADVHSLVVDAAEGQDNQPYHQPQYIDKLFMNEI